LAGWLVGPLGGLLVRSFFWSVGRLVGWFVIGLFGLLVSWLVVVFVNLGWLVGLVGSLAAWLLG
jgi:hypothetical protein